MSLRRTRICVSDSFARCSHCRSQSQLKPARELTWWSLPLTADLNATVEAVWWLIASELYAFIVNHGIVSWQCFHENHQTHLSKLDILQESSSKSKNVQKKIYFLINFQFNCSQTERRTMPGGRPRGVYRAVNPAHIARRGRFTNSTENLPIDGIFFSSERKHRQEQREREECEELKRLEHQRKLRKWVMVAVAVVIVLTGLLYSLL